MALAFVGESANPAATLSGVSATTQTCTRTVTAGNALIALASGIGSAANVTFSDGVNTWTTATTVTPLGGGFQCSATGIALNVAGGSTTVTATFDASVHHSFVILIEVSGAKLASALEGKAGQYLQSAGTGTDALTSGNPSPAPTTTANTFVCGFIVNFNNNVAPTAVGTGFTQTGAVKYTASMGGVQGEYKIVSATGTYPATFTCTTVSDNWTIFVAILAEASAAAQVPPPASESRIAAAESWVVPDVVVKRRNFTAPKIDAPQSINQNATTDRIAADDWWPLYGPHLVRRPLVVQPKIDNPPVLPWTSTADRIAADSWPIDYGAARRAMLTAPRIDSPPLILPLSLVDRAAAESWSAEDPRLVRRLAPLVVAAASPPPTMGSPNTARIAVDTWPLDYGATRKPIWTDGAHDAPPPRAAPPVSAGATWTPDELVPRAPARTVQSVDAPPARGPIATAWAAVESWITELVSYRRQLFTDGAHDAPPPYQARAFQPAGTWQSDEQARPRSSPVPQGPPGAQVPAPRSQIAGAQSWEATEAPALPRPRFTSPAIDAPPPRVPVARAAVDTWTPPDDVRARPAQAPQGQAAQVDSPVARGPIATLWAALETWIGVDGQPKRAAFTSPKVDNPPGFSATSSIRSASESWVLPDTRLPPRYQPQLPPPTNQPTPIGNVNTIRALLESWLVEFGWTRRPLFTAGQVDQPVPLPWTSTSDRVALDSWADSEPARAGAPRAPQAAPAQPPGSLATSARVAGESWLGEAGPPRRAPAVVPGSIDAPPPRGVLASARAALEGWAADAAAVLRRVVAVPGSVDAPSPSASKVTRQAVDTWVSIDGQQASRSRVQIRTDNPAPRVPVQHDAASTWKTEGGWVRRPTAPIPPPIVNNPPPTGSRIPRVLAAATWDFIDNVKLFRSTLMKAANFLRFAHLRRRSRADVAPSGTRAVVAPGRNRVVVDDGGPTKTE